MLIREKWKRHSARAYYVNPSRTEYVPWREIWEKRDYYLPGLLYKFPIHAPSELSSVGKDYIACQIVETLSKWQKFTVKRNQVVGLGMK